MNDHEGGSIVDTPQANTPAPDRSPQAPHNGPEPARDDSGGRAEDETSPQPHRR